MNRTQQNEKPPNVLFTFNNDNADSQEEKEPAKIYQTIKYKNRRINEKNRGEAVEK